MNPSSSPSSNRVSGSGDTRATSLRRSLARAAYVVAAAAVVVAITAFKPATISKLVEPPRATTAAEQRAILTLVIQDLQAEGQAESAAGDAVRRPLVMDDKTVAACAMPRRGYVPCMDIPPDSIEHLAKSFSVPKALVDALAQFNTQPYALDTRTLPDIIPVDRERLAAVFDKGEWPEFYRTYPRANGILRVSRPVISARGDQALLYVAHSYGNLGGEGWVALAERRQGKWKIVGRVGLWIS